MLTIPVQRRCPTGSHSILASFRQWWDRSLLASCLSSFHCGHLHKPRLYRDVCLALALAHVFDSSFLLTFLVGHQPSGWKAQVVINNSLHQNKVVHFSPIQQEHRTTLLHAFYLPVTLWFARNKDNLFLSFSVFRVPIYTVNWSSPQEIFHFPLYLSKK